MHQSETLTCSPISQSQAVPISRDLMPVASDASKEGMMRDARDAAVSCLPLQLLFDASLRSL